MPIYEYHCESCGHNLEALQKLSDAPLIDCPACNKPNLKKKVSAAGFRLSGGGWYETDFKSGKKKNIAGESGTGAPAAANVSPATSGSSAPGAAPKSSASPTPSAS